MNNPLEMLAKLVLEAESTALSRQLDTELKRVSTLLKECEERNRLAQQHLAEIRKRKSRELEEVEIEKKQLQELIRKAAQFRAHLTEEQRQEAERLIDMSRRSIETRQQKVEADYVQATSEAETALETLKEAREKYEVVRRDVDRLQPHLVSNLTHEDRLMAESSIYFPSGELRALQKEIEDSGRHYGALSQKEQYAQMKIWIGRLRHLQTKNLSEEEQVQARQLFPALVEISKTYKPGYIEAFQQDFHTDWELFVAESRDELQQAIEFSRKKRETDILQKEHQFVRDEQKRKAREAAQVSLDELRGVIQRYMLPEEGLEEFRDSLLNVIAGYGTSDPEVLELVLPYREQISEGAEFRALRRNLDKLASERASGEANETLPPDLVDLTRGKRAMMIGGARREEARRQLEKMFEFDELTWEDYEDSKPAMLRSIEQRIGNRSVDFVIMLRSFIAHHVSDKIRPVCAQSEVPCILVDHGYGPQQVEQAFRKWMLPKEQPAG